MAGLVFLSPSLDLMLSYSLRISASEIGLAWTKDCRVGTDQHSLSGHVHLRLNLGVLVETFFCAAC